MPQVTMGEAARILGVSVDTIKRRLQRGELAGHRKGDTVNAPWLIELPDAAPAEAPASAPAGIIDARADAPAEDAVALRELVATLQWQVQVQGQQLVTKDHQIAELLTVVRQAQAALPAPKDSRSWWRRLWPG